MTDDETILAVNAAYYDAFADHDFDRMSAIWAEDDISCIHPGWPVLVGREVVIQSYKNILNHPNQERVIHRHDTAMVTGDDGRVFCVEFVGGMALAVTNWFRKVEGAWKMIHHQASLINPTAEELKPDPATRLN